MSWQDLVDAKITANIFSKMLPKSASNEIGCPFPEDLILRGELWIEDCSPENWFFDIEDE